MAHLDLVWPGLVLGLCIAAALAVRVVADHADRVARQRSRKWVERLGPSDREGDVRPTPTSHDASARDRSA